MHIDLENKRASLSVGDFSDFMPGPRDSAGAASGLWRAQLGTRWHKELQVSVAAGPDPARFEVALQGELQHQGWTLALSGRIDQFITQPRRRLLREIKTVLRPLPADEGELRSQFPSYFIQAALYAMMVRQGDPASEPRPPLATELLFVEADSGLSQSLLLGPADEALCRAQLDRVVGFLQQRWHARERLLSMRILAPFERFRPGQEEALLSLRATLQGCHSAILFQAPTGFGKTGILLDASLGEMRAGHFERLVYLTSKATGQLQVLETLRRICGVGAAVSREHNALNLWLVRPKSEHCVNEVFRCLRETCPYLCDLPQRWERSGVQGLYMNPETRREIADLREVGRGALVCPYEITRAALPYSEVWIGDINYVFAPAVRGLFMEQTGFSPERTLLIVDEAHNLPARVADAYSQRFRYDDALLLASELKRLHAPQSLLRPQEEWVQFLRHLPEAKALRIADEEDALQTLRDLAQAIVMSPMDTVSMDAQVAELLWSIPSFVDAFKAQPDLKRHWWSPQQGELCVTCIDAAPAIGETLRQFGGVLLSSATFGPADAYAASIGMDALAAEHTPESLARLMRKEEPEPPPSQAGKLGILTKRETRRLFSKITSGAELLRVEEERGASALATVFAGAPWREGAYEVAVDLRVDTRFQHRELYYANTASTLQSWHHLDHGRSRLCAVFFPSYVYAESIIAELARIDPALRVALQPRKVDLAQQTDWVTQALAEMDLLFLVLGSSFAEGIDMLGGAAGRTMIVGPALPEVNPIQHARMEALASLGRDESFRRVYQIPGMQKVNQALGRLVRAPGHHARVLLHCRRFAESAYNALLLPEYQNGVQLGTDAELRGWFASTPPA